MLIREIISESMQPAEIANDLMDLIVSYRRKNRTVIPMNGDNGAIQYLRNLGYNADAAIILNVLDGEQFTGDDSIIDRSDTNSITLRNTSPDSNLSADQQENSQDFVARVAGKAATDAVKSGDKLG